MPDEKAEHTMRVSRRTWDELDDRKGPGDSFDDMVQKAMKQAGWIEEESRDSESFYTEPRPNRRGVPAVVVITSRTAGLRLSER